MNWHMLIIYIIYICYCWSRISGKDYSSSRYVCIPVCQGDVVYASCYIRCLSANGEVFTIITYRIYVSELVYRYIVSWVYCKVNARNYAWTIINSNVVIMIADCIVSVIYGNCCSRYVARPIYIYFIRSWYNKVLPCWYTCVYATSNIESVAC